MKKGDYLSWKNKLIVEDKFDMTYMYELLRPQPYRGHIYTWIQNGIDLEPNDYGIMHMDVSMRQ